MWSFFNFLVLYSARHKNVTYIVHVSSLQCEKSQFSSFFISYSIRHAAEMWQTSNIFQVLKVKIVWSSVIILLIISYSIRIEKYIYWIKIYAQNYLCSTVWLFMKIYKYVNSRVLFGTRQKCDIHRRFFKFTEWKSLTRTLFGTKQKYDLSYIF